MVFCSNHRAMQNVYQLCNSLLLQRHAILPGLGTRVRLYSLRINGIHREARIN